MEAAHFKEVMEELEGVMIRIQTHWRPGNLIKRIFFLMLFSPSNCDDDDKGLLMHKMVVLECRTSPRSNEITFVET